MRNERAHVLNIEDICNAIRFYIYQQDGVKYDIETSVVNFCYNADNILEEIKIYDKLGIPSKNGLHTYEDSKPEIKRSV